MISRNLSTLEGFYNNSRGMVQFGLKIQKKDRIPEILDILMNNVFALRLRTTNSKMISKFDINNQSLVNQTKIYPIPSNLDLIDSCRYMYTNHSKPLNEILGTIGFNNDNIIVLNVSHLVGDGKYLTFILDYLISKLTNANVFESSDSMMPLNSLISSSKSNDGQLPINMESIFSKQIKASSNIKLPHIFVDEGFTHVNPRTKVQKNQSDNQKPCQFVSFNFPVNEFRCYNKQNDRCSGLSEVIWSSFILSAAAFNDIGNSHPKNIFGPDTSSSPGVTTCVDMRQYLNDKSLINWRAANLYSSVTVSAPYSESNANLSPSNELLGNFEKRLRNDFMNKIRSGYQYAFLNTLTPPDPEMVIPGIGLEVSSIGPFYISRRNESGNQNISKNNIFSDIFIKSSVSDMNCDPLISFSSYSVINEIEGRKDFYTNMRYKSSIFSPIDANLVGKGTEFAMKNLSPSMTVKEAIEAIRQFQKTI